jgi:CRISPR-associated protein Csb2
MVMERTQRERMHQPPNAMIVLELRFPTGRLHATPWGRHVNEGALEWPPSPWRILRALIATWYLKARDAGDSDLMRSLVQKLSEQPRFWLPPATTGHTRHYMPGNEATHKESGAAVFGPAKTKVFDTFIQLDEESVVRVVWDVDLPDNERIALKTLAERLGYFGRAESLVVADVKDEWDGEPPNAMPLDHTAELPKGTELVRLLVPMTANNFKVWRSDFLAKGPPPTEDKKKPSKKALESEDSRVPQDLFAALHADTGDLQAAGWNLPPGAQFVNYTRPENAFAPATKPRPRRAGPLPTVARFALTSVVPPAITKALAVGEQVHKVLCSEKISNGHPTFSGAGSKDHQHAHIFCESVDDSNAHITHVTVYSPKGFDHVAVEALRKIQWTWGFKGHDLRTVLHGIGQPHDFNSLLFAASKTWRSVTPFVSTRHAKTFRDGRPKMDDNGWQKGSAAHDLLRLLALNPKWEGAKIRRQIPEREQPFQFGSRKFRSLQFQSVRLGGKGSRGHDSGAAFIIEFPDPVSGPIAVGYGAHFGLGLFAPM